MLIPYLVFCKYFANIFFLFCRLPFYFVKKIYLFILEGELRGYRERGRDRISSRLPTECGG